MWIEVRRIILFLYLQKKMWKIIKKKWSGWFDQIKKSKDKKELINFDFKEWNGKMKEIFQEYFAEQIAKHFKGCLRKALSRSFEKLFSTIWNDWSIYYLPKQNK